MTRFACLMWRKPAPFIVSPSIRGGRGQPGRRGLAPGAVEQMAGSRRSARSDRWERGIMLAYTYRLRVGQRLRHLALLTAIGAVLNVADRHPTTVVTSQDDVT